MKYYKFVLVTLKELTISRFATFSIIALLSLFSWSQHSISGEVKDRSGSPVAYANILLLTAQDSTVVDGTSSGDFGEFKFENILAGDYLIKTSFIGYNTSFISVAFYDDIKDVQIVLLEAAEELSEVALVFKKPTLKREVDRLVFNVESTALSEGNMLETLRSTPGVIILDDVIRVKNSSPTVYINDRKVHLSSSDLIQLLQGTSASIVKSVEVITNPSARYDADSGIVLNIVMAKNLTTGYNGSLYSYFEQGVFPRNGHGTSHYFKGERLDFFLNYNYSDRKEDAVNDEAIFYPDEAWQYIMDRNTWSETHNLALNLDYQFNDRSSLAIASNLQFLPYFKRLSFSTAEISSEINNPYTFTTANLSRDVKDNIGLNIDFNQKISDNTDFTVNGHYTNYDYGRDQNVSSNYFDNNNQFVSNTRFFTRADLLTEIFTAQVDFSTKINDNSSLDYGGKYSDITTDSGLLHLNFINGQEELDLSRTNTFLYEEDILASYVNYQTSGDKFSFNLGLRLEDTKTSGVSSNGELNKNDYFEWFPTISMGYQLSDKLNTYTNFKRSINRPVYKELNPFLNYINDNTVVTGNPNLRPELLNRYTFGLSVNDQFFFEIYYNAHNDKEEQLPLQDNLSKVLTFTAVNIDRTKDFGFDIETYFEINDRWSLYAAHSLYKSTDKGVITGESFKKGRWASYAIFTNDWSFFKDNSLSINLDINYSSKNIQGFQEVGTIITSNLSIRKTLFSGKGILSLSANDLFNENDVRIVSNFGDQNISQFFNLDTRYVRIGFRYKFGNTKLSTNERTTDIDERNRLEKED